MATYTFSFKKGNITVQYRTNDRGSMERQFQIWVTCASVYTYNKRKIEQGLPADPLPAAPSAPATTPSPARFRAALPSSDAPLLQTASVAPSENPPLSPAQEAIKRESERIAKEIKQEFELANKSIQNEFKNVLDEHAAKPLTINNMNEEPQKPENSDFDAILGKSLTAVENTALEKVKDERFLKVLKAKNAGSNLEYLIIAAYYLCEFERLDRFTIKQVNAKLMQNMSTIVNNSTVQNAIDKRLIEELPNFTNETASVEYRLTEAGEDAFLNGLRTYE